MILAEEDNWIRTGIYLLHDPLQNDPIPFDEAPWNEDYINIEFAVSYGRMDVFNSSYLCDVHCEDKACIICDGSMCGDKCRVGRGNITMLPLEQVPQVIEYSFARDKMNVTDTWVRLDSYVFREVMYKPKPNVNSKWLRKMFLESDTFLPWEIMHLRVLYNNPSYELDPATRVIKGPWLHVGEFRQLVHIIDINDAPVISPPTQVTLKCDEPPTTEKPRPPLQCYFGQFFSYEDTETKVGIPNIAIWDEDLDEQCEIGEECAKMDVEVRAFRGALGLNTRSNLNFYDIGDPLNRAGQGFTAYSTDVQNAIKVLFYQVELGAFLGPNSQVLHYNTQTSENSEYITVTATDQGFNGADGIAKSSLIQVDIEIVATNDEPAIVLEQVEFEATEDVEEHLQGISVLDVDIDETISSKLAYEDWMGRSSQSVFLKQMMVTARVVYGVLKLGYLRNLQLISTSTMTYMTIDSKRFGHHLCYVDGVKDDTQKLTLADPTNSPVQPYQELCFHNNLGSTRCETGVEKGCMCTLDNTCLDGKFVLHLDRSKNVEPFQTAIIEAIDRENRTCGGMPVFPQPNNFTQGVKCEVDYDCAHLETCEMGKTCRCCSNLEQVCSSNSDCSVFDAGSLCGCIAGAHGGKGQCGPFKRASAPNGNDYNDLIQPGVEVEKLSGQPCHYVGPGSELCSSAAFAHLGTNLAKIVDLVALSSRGSQEFQVFGPMVDINRAIGELRYQTNLHYNRFFRIPVEERDPLTFNIETDSVDTLTIEASDMGNSGGLLRDIKSSRVTATVRVAAVNDRPKANGPAQVKAFEDLPLTFMATPDHPLETSMLSVSDPDSQDYRFSEKILHVNLSCTHGRLFLNEEYLKSDWNEFMGEDVHPDDRNPNLANIRYKLWDGQQQRGLHWANPENGVHEPHFGNGCQTKPQCSDGDTLVSKDSRYGFFATRWYGVVYSPQINGDGDLVEIGCGFCPDDAGNRFISISGTMANLNKALSTVTYLPDPDFNTRYGISEAIVFEVNDGGAQGNDNQLVELTHRHVVNVIVESVNDRPFVGVRKRVQRQIKSYDGGQTSDRVVDDYRIDKIDKSIEEECFSLAPASPEYWAKCNTTVRRFIDIDEDTQFYIGPQTLWISDVDSAESEQMPQLRRYCCAQAGEVACTCGRTCRCGSSLCSTCSAPEVCQGGEGKLLVSLKVRSGQLSFYPPPGREVFPPDEVTFLTNVTSFDMKEGGFMEPCDPQIACMRNVSRLQMRTNIAQLQKGIEQLFLSYQGRPNWYGSDQLEIWVSDQGMTDECYNSSLSVTETINIRVVGINDPPTLQEPESVLVYQKGQRCYVDWHQFETSSIGMIPSCEFNPNSSLVPPSPRPALAFNDVDINDAVGKIGDMTVIIAIGNDGARHGTAGGLMFSEVRMRTNTWFSEFRSEGLRRLMIQGTIEDINWLMQRLRYDADPSYQGYAPFIVNVNDNLNYGECNGNHVCGAFQAVCMDHTKAEAHVEPDPGINRVVLDVTVGSSVRCQASTCDACNSESGCGWCPGACVEQGGKCMIGGPSGPKFESCDKDASGLGWMQCMAPTTDIMTLAGAVGGTGFGLLVIGYIFYRWVQRRHGSLFSYVRKKRVDTLLMLRKLNILPPSEANYNQFFLLTALGVAVIVAMPFLASTNPTCNYRKNFFLDRIESVHLSLDNCKVRFLPTRFSPAPENDLEAPKIKVAYSKDKDVILEAESCTLDARFAMINQRPESVRYLGYFCNIDILVPDRYVLPKFTIEAAGENTTSVRSSSTDADSTEFGLDFGPNRFTLTGHRLVAQLQNVSAKFFEYNVVHGALNAIDLSTTVSGTFSSNDADMVVTTKFRTSVDFWQKSGNKVCLTAAEKSLYVDDACEEVCALRNSSAGNGTSSARRSARQKAPGTAEQREEPVKVRMQDIPPQAFENRNQSGDAKLRVLGAETITMDGLVITNPVAGDNRTKWICNGDPDADEQWSCLPYDAVDIALSKPCPLGSDYETKGDVPRIDGCTNLDLCFVEESSQCLCKPACDMANLNPPGTCNEGGQCCQISCAGYSKADLFPQADQPRCGAKIDPSLTWCDGQLDQKFTFTSDQGQISVQVLEGCDPYSPSECSNASRPVSSYRGAPPISGRQPITIDFPLDNKKILNEVFHPGGASAPRVDWFNLGISGPGTADKTYGQFVFLKSVRHLVLPPWLMNVVSYGLLAPDSGASTSRLNPGFCPAYQNYSSTEFNQRLAQMYRLILDTVQFYPPEEKEKIIPVGSLIAFQRVSDVAKIFLTDTTTNQVTVGVVNPWDYPLLLMLIGLGIGIPFLFATFGTGMLFLKGRVHLNEYRKAKLLQEHFMRNLGAVLNRKGQDHDDEDEDVPRERVEEMTGRTGFFYMYEEFVGDAEAQRTMFAQWGLVLSELLASLLPLVFVFLISGIIETSYRAHKCSVRYDVCRCLSEQDAVLLFPLLLRILVYIYFFVALAEIGLHYLAVSFNLCRRVLRVLFYALFFGMIWLSILITGTLFLFVILGVLVKASITGPYAISVLGTLAVAVAMFVNKVKLLTRVSRAVIKRVGLYKSKVPSVPPKLLDLMMSKSIQQALHDHWLSVPRIVISVVVFLFGMVLVFFFLFMGFKAFTDPTDLNAALINMGILVGVISGAYTIMVGDGDPGEFSHRVDMLTESIMHSLEKILDMIGSQIEMAKVLYDRMKELDRGHEDEESDFSSDDDEQLPLVTRGKAV